MANIDSAIGDARRRAASYADIDGLLTLSQSAFALAAGFLGALRHRINTEWSLFAFSFMLLCWLIFGQPDGPVLLWLKTRITYPRTGFVALPPPTSTVTSDVHKRHKILQWAAGGALLAAWAYSNYAANTWLSLMAMTGGIAAVCLVDRHEARWRLVWLIIPSLWLSEVIKIFRPTWPIDEGVSMFFIFSILLFIAGTVRLLRFLKLHRAPPV